MPLSPIVETNKCTTGNDLRLQQQTKILSLHAVRHIRDDNDGHRNYCMYLCCIKILVSFRNNIAVSVESISTH